MSGKKGDKASAEDLHVMDTVEQYETYEDYLDSQVGRLLLSYFSREWCSTWGWGVSCPTTAHYAAQHLTLTLSRRCMFRHLKVRCIPADVDVVLLQSRSCVARYTDFADVIAVLPLVFPE